MSFNPMQFRDLIERALTSFDPALATPDAIALLMGTAAQESQFGTYLMQRGGPAVGVFQMEPTTFEWLQRKYKRKYPELVGRFAHEMEHDIRLAVIMARLRYRVVADPLPAANDIGGMALYWKAHYNTPAGKGTPRQFAQNFRRYVV